jgi:hypothetical protein
MLVFLVALGGATSNAWAQYGLYGSPELLRLSPATGDAPPPEQLPDNSIGQPIQASAQQAATVPDYPVAVEQRNPSPTYAAAAKPNLAPPAPKLPPAARRSTAPTPSSLAPVPDSPSMTNQLLDEMGGYGQGSGCGPGEVANGCAPGRCDSGRADACAEACLDTQCDSLWYASAAAIMFTRDQGNRVWTTFEEDNNPNQLMNTNDAKLGWEPGYEIKFGRRFCCGIWAIEASVWRIDGFTAEHSQLPVTAGGHVSTPLAVDELDFGTAGTGQDFFDGAEEHRLRRRNEFNNVEINFIRNRMADGWSDAFDLSGSFGFRYFQFYEDLRFTSLRQGGSWSNLVDQANIEDRIRNNFFALQFGLDGRYNLGYNLHLFASPKIGLGVNHIENRFDPYRGDGLRATPSASSHVVGSYPTTGKSDGFSFLGQIDVGVDWQFHPQWKAFVGYRMITMTGVGLADHQIPMYLVDIPEERTVHNNGSLLLHGGFAGLEFNF